MNRRNFITGLAGILAAGYAPASITSGVLMPARKVWTPPPVEVLIQTCRPGLPSVWIDSTEPIDGDGTMLSPRNVWPKGYVGRTYMVLGTMDGNGNGLRKLTFVNSPPKEGGMTVILDDGWTLAQ